MVAIDSNAALKNIAFSDIVSIDEQIAHRQPSARSVDLGALERIESLNVVNNALLSTAAFDGLQIGGGGVSGNP